MMPTLVGSPPQIPPFRGGFRITKLRPGHSRTLPDRPPEQFGVRRLEYARMASPDDAVAEFRAAWLPHVSDDGLGRLIDLLGKASPLLIHGAFTNALPMGCLATHIAWNHPRTRRLHHEAGVVWLAKVVGLNPATSAVILAWDRDGHADLDLRSELLTACVEEQSRRAEVKPEHAAC